MKLASENVEVKRAVIPTPVLEERSLFDCLFVCLESVESLKHSNVLKNLSIQSSAFKRLAKIEREQSKNHSETKYKVRE